MPTRIGLNVLYLIPGVVGGTETYARELIAALAQSVDPTGIVVFVNREAASWALPEDVTRVICEVDARQRWRRYIYEQLVLPSRIRAMGLELLHSLGYVAPLRLHVPSVVTVHDLNFLHTGMTWTRRNVLRAFVTAGVRNAEIVVTDSEHSRNDILRAIPSAGARVRVVYLGGDHRVRALNEPSLTRFGQERYFLAFSSLSRHKNIGALLESFRRASDVPGFSHRLVVVGHARPDDIAAAAGVARITMTGPLPDAEVAMLTAGADYIVVPSTYEGFGLPVAEAIAMGVPSLVANRASLPEIAGPAALTFEPTRVDDLAALLIRAAADRSLRDRLAGQARGRAPFFSWRSTARTMVNIYEEAMNSHERSRRGGMNGRIQ